jgi:hypothetical protein
MTNQNRLCLPWQGSQRLETDAQSVNERMMLQLRSLSCLELLAHAPLIRKRRLFEMRYLTLRRFSPLPNGGPRPLRRRAKTILGEAHRETVSHQALARPSCGQQRDFAPS